LLPLFFKIDKEMMYLRYVDDSINFADEKMFLSKGWKFDDLIYTINVIDGAENVEVSDKVVTLKKSGYVVLEVSANATVDGKNYEMKDRVSINISGKQIEKK
ncbi:MAG: hypothetical protein RR458_06890, partial [Clostridia bacterium]